MASSEAQAAVDQYSVEGASEVAINLEVCSAESQLAVRGDTSSDLDFFITDASGSQVHADEGIDDYISIVLEKPGDECETFALNVVNLGTEGNDFTVLLEPISDSTVRVQKYIIQPNETRTVSFKACGTSVKVSARGDGDTDLDFVIRNSDEAVVHESDDVSDETEVQLEGLLSDCERFEMDVVNLGNVYNALMVVVAPDGVTSPDYAGAEPTTSLGFSSGRDSGDVSSRPASLADGSGAGTYRADANASIRVNLPVCGTTRLEVRGDGDTDLDFTVTDEGGEAVHSDIDLSDVTFATLSPVSECETYDLRVDNLGTVFNEFTIALIDPASRAGTSGPGEYRVSAALATKVALRVCGVTNVRARGDGDTDLDFEVVDASGSVLHENYDLTDVTEFTLDPGGNCADFQLKVSNLGDVYNLLTVDFDGDRSGQSQRPNPAAPNVSFGFAKGGASQEPVGRGITIQNRSGEALSSMFWSNSASFEWGEDMLSGGASLAPGANWEVDVNDGSSACLFDFRGVTESQREIRVRAVNVCDLANVTLE